jgi:hypothetical protein
MTPADTSAEAVERVASMCEDFAEDGDGAAEAAALLRALAKERDQLRDTNRRLNQRCQAAEASLPDYRKIIAVPPDGDGVRFVSGNLGRALAVTMCAKLDDKLAEQETLLAERNRQNAAAFADRDALLADQRRLLYLASTASMNWGHRERAGYTLDPLQFESARDVIRPDDFRRAIDAAMAGPCADIRAAKVHP